MQLNSRSQENVAILDLSGRLTMAEGAGRLKDKVTSLVFEGQKHIVLNLAGLTYTDSAGLGEMVACHLTASRAGGAVKLSNLGTKIQDLLVMTKLLTVFDVYDSDEEAVNSFRASTV